MYWYEFEIALDGAIVGLVGLNHSCISGWHLSKYAELSSTTPYIPSNDSFNAGDK